MINPDYNSINLNSYYLSNKLFKLCLFHDEGLLGAFKQVKLFEELPFLNSNFQNDFFLKEIQAQHSLFPKATNCIFSGYKNIFIISKNNSLFSSEVMDALKTIDSQPIGSQLLETLGKRTKPIYLLEGTTDAACEKLHIISLCLSSLKTLGKNGENIPFPFFAKVAHELIHIYHDTEQKTGLLLHPAHALIWTNEKEYRVIMRGSEVAPNISENAIRREHGLPERYSHLFSTNVPPFIRSLVKAHAQQW